MLTAEELAAIKEREAKATKGPWSCSTEENGNTVTIRAADGTPHTLGTEITEKCCDGEPSEEEAANGYFIAHARTDIPPGLKKPIDLMKAKDFWIGGLTPDSSKDVIERLQLDMLGISYRYLSGFKGSPEARHALEKGEIAFYNEGIASWFASIEPNMGRRGEVIPVWYDPMDDGVEMKAPPDAAGVPAKPFHEFYEEALGRKPSALEQLHHRPHGTRRRLISRHRMSRQQRQRQ